MSGAALRPRVGIFRTVYPLQSETFIREQFEQYRRYAPTMIGRTWMGAGSGESQAAVTLGTERRSRLRQLLWSATRTPRAFPLRKLSNMKLIHAHFGPDGVMSLPLASALGVPLVTTFHGGDVTTHADKFGASRKPTERWFAAREAELQRDGAAFIAVSRFIAARLTERGYAASKVIQHYIGVDTARFAPIDATPERRYVLCVGRHVPKKGVDTLIRAWARIASRHPDVELLQVGSGPLLEAHTVLARELGVESRIRFLGGQGHDRVLQLMRSAEVFALPSQTAEDGDSEALGIVFNEASACAVPVVSTRHGGIPEAVLHGETGLLGEERDDAALAQHLDAVLGDRALGRRLGLRGREWVLESFDIVTQTAKLERVYDGLIGRA